MNPNRSISSLAVLALLLLASADLSGCGVEPVDPTLVACADPDHAGLLCQAATHVGVCDELSCRCRFDADCLQPVDACSAAACVDGSCVPGEQAGTDGRECDAGGTLGHCLDGACVAP